MGRRDALTLLGAGALGLTRGAAALAADADPGWIDAHIHVWTPDLARYPLKPGAAPSDLAPPSFTPDEFFAHARPVGVRRVVLIQMSFYGSDNAYMLDCIAAQPEVFRGVAVLADEPSPRRQMRDLKARGVRGLRIYPSPDFDDPRLAEIYRAASEENFAVCHLANPQDLPGVDAMCARWPDAPVVVDHFGRIGVDGEIRDADLDNLCRLARRPRAFVKVSAFYALGKKTAPYLDLIPMIRRVLDAFGPERLMWASDSPYQVQDGRRYEDSLALVRDRLDFLSPGDREHLLRKTAERVFFA
jgi:predicted TIM-barrel fold metal-dependent hydrolase